MRRCKQCKTDIMAAAKCTDIIEKKGYCSVECLAEHVRSARKASTARKERKAMREAKERVKTRQQWLEEAQSAVNKYIRLRDAGKPCISCDRRDDGTHQRHASHYRSRGACSSLRFHEDNIHASCAQCNGVMSGNILEYRIRLVRRIGIDRVEWIERQPKSYKWTIEDARLIKNKYLLACNDSRCMG